MGVLDGFGGRGPHVSKHASIAFIHPFYAIKLCLLQEERPVPTPGKGRKLQLLSFEVFETWLLVVDLYLFGHPLATHIDPLHFMRTA